MFFLLGIIAICIILLITLVFSTVELEIKNLKISIPKEESRYVNKEYEIIIRLSICKKIIFFKLDITKTFLERKKVSNIINKMTKKFEKDKNNFDVKIFETLKKISIQIKNMQLKIMLGTEDAAITAILIGIIASTLGILLKNKINKSQKQKFETIPVYQNKNMLKIDFDGIFQINMIHIIYIIIYVLKRKRRVSKNVRTSNRRSYVYSDE